jgi:hypothetical protein
MRSVLVSEPASPGDLLITEWSDQVQNQGDTFTFYCGTSTHIGPQWKGGPSHADSGGGALTSICDTKTHSIEGLFATRFSAIRGIERVLIRKDHDFFRVWVVIPDIDLALEDQIYAAQFLLMDRFPEIPFDFAVIFRQGKDPDSIQPSRARQAYPSL